MARRMEKKRKIKLRRRKQLRIGIFIGIILSFIVIGGFIYNKLSGENNEVVNDEISDDIVDKTEVADEVKDEVKEVMKQQIIISAAGDCTLGTDTKFGIYGSFQQELKKFNNDYSHFMKNVAPIFKEDDYSLVNLETTLTDATVKVDKGGGTVYHFKGPKEYINILSTSYIDGVTIDNNHIYDYGQKGLNDTINTLNEYKIDYCGRGNKVVREVKGIKMGILGYSSFRESEELKNNIKNDIEQLRETGCSIVITYFHWGNENEYEPNDVQRKIAKFAIDNGADMVLGSHPHVVQSLEKYNGKLIVYSLGNFSFGGNSNPTDKRTFIMQSKFNLEDKVVKSVEFKVIPTNISSVENRNDFVPTPATGNRVNEIIKKLNELSPTLNGSIKSEFFSL